MITTKWEEDPYVRGKFHRLVVHPLVGAWIIKFDGKKTNWLVRAIFRFLSWATNSRREVKYG